MLKVTKNQQLELKKVRQNIKACYKDISCFLMPHPGATVAENVDFDGRLKSKKGFNIKKLILNLLLCKLPNWILQIMYPIADIRDVFKDQLAIFVPELLGAENLVAKEVGGVKIKAQDLLNYFECYMKIFSDGRLPEITSVVQVLLFYCRKKSFHCNFKS